MIRELPDSRPLQLYMLKNEKEETIRWLSIPGSVHHCFSHPDLASSHRAWLAHATWAATVDSPNHSIAGTHGWAPGSAIKPHNP
jgi:hypothetical protein